MTSTEFDKATDFALTDEDIERARLLIGVDVAAKHNEHITTASYDSIRNFAWGVGEDNPLYCDEDYGTTTHWGSQIAPNRHGADRRRAAARRRDARRDQGRHQGRLPRRPRLRLRWLGRLVPAGVSG
jgi:hypothetical protein